MDAILKLAANDEALKRRGDDMGKRGFLLAALLAATTCLYPASWAATATAPPLDPSKPETEQTLDCSDPQDIRDFKDAILATLDPDARSAEMDARCLCGKAAGRAGRNTPAPPKPRSVPAFPPFDSDDPAASMEKAKDWYLRHLPVNGAQAAQLAWCAYGKSFAKATAKPKNQER